MTAYHSIQLLDCANKAYTAHNHYYAMEYKKKRQYHSVDPFNQAFNHQLRFWETVIQRVLAVHSITEENRILRYCTETGYANYHEIDYIAKTDGALTFCEIKLKQCAKIQQTPSGFEQLSTSLDIAQLASLANHGVLVTVNLASLFENACLIPTDDLAELKDIELSLSKTTADIDIFYIDIAQVIPFAKAHNIITQDNIDELVESYHDYLNPMRRLQTQSNLPLNNPFQALRQHTMQ
ncbi:hypothetical protein [Photobacterium toruni]|uniref:Uncharacterized protein n=1 Tax=Photobacterium toruni TaxID=1935446 RepID=A0A1T4UGY0_9GAMM|nr:hypothetical protein [Photobacterium toruni]SKA51856.1 hypothetical protein CZ814_03228 [Photobacterium toruni]